MVITIKILMRYFTFFFLYTKSLQLSVNMPLLNRLQWDEPHVKYLIVTWG